MIETKKAPENIETIKGNVLIAEFEGRMFYGKYLISCYGEATLNHYPEMKYHSSWDWLMPVVDKINKTVVKINEEENGIDRYSSIIESFDTVDINRTWLAVVDFIKWYNGK